MILAQETDGDLTPESRAAVLAEVLHFMATKMEPVPYEALLAHLMEYFKAREELVSLYAMNSVLRLCTAGLLGSNTYHKAPANREEWLLVKAETTVSPSRQLTNFAFGRIE